MVRIASVAALLVALSACVSLPSAEGPKEYLDQETAATVSVVGKPLVFARERRELAAYSRDYVTVAAAAVDRAGKVNYVLIVYFWSTVDQRDKPSAVPVADPLVIAADDRRIRLPLSGHTAQDAGIGIPVHAPPGHSALPNVYRTDLGTLRFMSEARHLAVLSGTDATAVSYEIWDDERPAWRALVRLLSGER
jgi:hypothetical protein